VEPQQIQLLNPCFTLALTSLFPKGKKAFCRADAFVYAKPDSLFLQPKVRSSQTELEKLLPLVLNQSTIQYPVLLPKLYFGLFSAPQHGPRSYTFIKSRLQSCLLQVVLPTAPICQAHLCFAIGNDVSVQLLGTKLWGPSALSNHRWAWPAGFVGFLLGWGWNMCLQHWLMSSLSSLSFWCFVAASPSQNQKFLPLGALWHMIIHSFEHLSHFLLCE
jgi:hypothetical protein